MPLAILAGERRGWAWDAVPSATEGTETAGGGKGCRAHGEVSGSHLCILHRSHSARGVTPMALNDLLQGVRAA